mmetsp:Transcript_29055/g.47010  ORF Transcript_29055/g.47010 Transcript_29055/m.47010 type:complete len:169 (+) Transcript_29055:170-676(+)
MIVSFCPDLQTAQRWDEEVGSPFVHLIDPKENGQAGAAYQSWGFPKSFQGVWSPEALKFYCDERLQGRVLHPSQGQDVHQMGGDVMVNHEGIIVLRHYSKTSQDRPSIDQLLTRARELAKPAKPCWLRRLFWRLLQRSLAVLRDLRGLPNTVEGPPKLPAAAAAPCKI